MDTPWRALQVKTNQEKRVAQHLTTRSLDYYLPLYSQVSKWSDRTVTLDRPLFPGYVFVRFLPAERTAVISTPGVLYVVGSGLSETIPSAEIEKIRSALAHGLSLRPHSKVVAGMPVRIIKGIFEGAEGIVIELRKQCRVVLIVSGLDQCFSLDVRLDDIEVIDPATEVSSAERQATVSVRVTPQLARPDVVRPRQQA